MSRKIPNAKEMGRRGGIRTKETQPEDFYQKIGEKGREELKRRDPDFYKKLSEAGVAARKAKKQEKEEAKESSITKITNLLLHGK